MSGERLFTHIGESGLSDVAAAIVPDLEGGTVIGVNGKMGVGKTTFIRHICIGLGSTDWVNSPTYSLIQSYESPQYLIIHVDLYRCEKQQEVHHLNLESYINGSSIMFIEWPERWADMTYDTQLYIQEDSTNTRTIRWIK